MTGSRFAICIKNSGYEASLELRKLYEVLSDPEADKHGYLRIIDESGEDYLYPRSFFVDLELPQQVIDRLLHAA